MLTDQECEQVIAYMKKKEIANYKLIKQSIEAHQETILEEQ